MGTRYLIDSNAVIDFLGGTLPENGKQMMMSIAPEISIITLIEVLSKKEMPELEVTKYRAFANASIIYTDISNDIAEQTISIRKQHGLKTPDAIIAATALANNLVLISRNEKDFRKIHNLKLINPWKL
jgi:predicted nucleic acid-binding protein